ncbi:MAG TPA: dienelactone hydrolase family protein [Candidatus Sabulitectum sp.]|nr:dienelactone hydrolase family protein [Candidatus Sabulitectum sp.]HPR22117.1 dienelactone hydrolase family protein [Candidatus Sabulitectum sp.]
MTILLIILVTGSPVDVFDPSSGDFLDSASGAEELFAMADSVYRAADYETAAELYLQGLRAVPGNSGAIYNLACCYGLLGRADLASAYLLRAWNAGFEDIGWAMGDPDFDLVREEEVFSSLVDSLSEAAQRRLEEMGEEIVFYAGAPFTCRVRVPSDYDGSTPVPLVIGIHGYGGSSELFIGLWEEMEDYGCIYACPRGPVPFFLGDRIGYSWFTGETPEERYASSVSSRDYILALLDELEERYAVSHVYLFGYSQGGGMTYLTGLAAPDRFTALAPFSGWLDMDVLTESELQAARDLPVRIVHGEQDRVVDYAAAVEGDSILSSMGYDVDVFTFQGEHMFSREGLRMFLNEFLGQ